MKKKVIIIPILIVAFAVLMSSFVVTKPGEYRVIKQFGRIVNVYENDGSSYGVNFKIPFIQSETVISSKMRLSDLPVSDVMTSDKKSMIADCFVMWKIEDPVKFIQKLSGSVQNAESRISSNVYNALKNVISSLSQEEVISGRDGELAQILTERLGTNLEAYGIKVAKIETKMLDLPDENKDKSKMLLIGDSLSTDILGGMNNGIDTCWYNPNNKPIPNRYTPTISINKLLQLTKKL